MNEVVHRKSRRKGAGREGRLEARRASTASKAIWPGIPGGRYQPMTHADMDKVHDASLFILEKTGIGDPIDELLDIVLPKGAFLNEYGRLCFPRALMEDLIAGAAREYVVHARGSRAGKDDIHCTGNKVYFSNSGTAVTTLDAQTKSYRPSTALDIYDFTRLVDTLDNIHMTGDTVLATDITDDFEHDINMVYAILAGSEKPVCLSFRSRDHIKPAIELFDMASGGEGAFLKKPSVIFGGCPIVSPLRFGRENLEILMDASRMGLTSDIAVAPQSGATSPTPLAGTLAQVVAETLACTAIVNLINPGCPMTFAAWPFITDLRTGSFTGGSGEQALVSAAAVQMGNYYDLPNSIGCGMTDSQIPDAQYGIEKSLTYTLAAHAGANRLCEVGGMMGSLMGCSFESMVIDDEVIGMVARTLRGIEVNDETLSLDVVNACAVDPGHFLGNEQTLAYMESEYVYPDLMDRSPTDRWQEEGSTDLFERSRTKAAQLLATHYPNYLGKEMDARVRDRFPIRISQTDMTTASGRW
ncbi:trimethylamine methyltransferase family protein [Hoeflea sp. TYP-13]|uniref:trimethylamine methyltransferase family protein n=1 Tax=Hoeflea sp. TYP-13 TaxID=3230023 RepID=UPI0034C61B9F